MPFSLYEYIRQGWSWLLVFRLLLGLGQKVRTLQRRAQGQIENDDADGGGHAVDEGDAAGDLGQGLGDGVILTEDIYVAEVAEERVGKDVQQQAGGSGGGHFDAAGAQLNDTTLTDALKRLKEAIDSQLDEAAEKADKL